jgi:hypothetical protein
MSGVRFATGTHFSLRHLVHTLLHIIYIEADRLCVKKISTYEYASKVMYEVGLE